MRRAAADDNTESDDGVVRARQCLRNDRQFDRAGDTDQCHVLDLCLLRDALRAGDQSLGDRRVPLPGNDRQLQILGLGDRELRLTFAAHSAVPGCAVFWFASYSSSPIRSCPIRSRLVRR